MAYDLGYDGAPILYSWPSRGDPQAYPADEGWGLEFLCWQENAAHWLQGLIEVKRLMVAKACNVSNLLVVPFERSSAEAAA